MRISFFEEFPSWENLRKLEILTFPTTIYLGAENLKEYRFWREEVRKIQPETRVVWWLLLRIEEGYWFSPFASPRAMERMFQDSKGEEIFLDLEIPLLSPQRILKVGEWSTGYRVLRKFIEKRKKEIIRGEIPLCPQALGKVLGLSYPWIRERVCYLLYSTLFPFWWIERKIKEGRELYGDNFMVGAGCIGKGITRMERIISPEEIRKVLQLSRKMGVREVIIYRLGGLRREFIAVLEEMLSA